MSHPELQALVALAQDLLTKVEQIPDQLVPERLGTKHECEHHAWHLVNELKYLLVDGSTAQPLRDANDRPLID